MLPGELVKVLEIGIQSIIETELSSILGAETYQCREGRTNYHNAQSKVSNTDFLWLLPLIKDIVGAKTKKSFQLAWTELTRVAQGLKIEKLTSTLQHQKKEPKTKRNEKRHLFRQVIVSCPVIKIATITGGQLTCRVMVWL
jgi:hypothetical protein